MDTPIALKQVILYETTFMPGRNGKAVNLKANLDTKSTEGQSLKLKLSLHGNFVRIDTEQASGLIPLAGCKMLIPVE